MGEGAKIRHRHVAMPRNSSINWRYCSCKEVGKKKYVPKNIVALDNVKTECIDKDIKGNNIHHAVNSPFVDLILNVDLGSTTIVQEFYPYDKKKSW